MLAAFAQVVLARTELRAGLGTSGFEQAERLAGPGPRPATGRLAAAALGQGPDHAGVAARHDRRALFAPSPGIIPGWVDEALSGDDIEHERLASAVLLRLLADGPVDSAKVRALDRAVRKLPPLTALCPAHFETPPLAASVIRSWVALGEPDAARALVEAWEVSNPSAERDAAATAQVRLATVHLVRRMRWRGLRDSLVFTLATSESTRRRAGRPGGTGPARKTTDESIGEQGPQAADIRWRTASALNDHDTSAVFRIIVPYLADADAHAMVAAHLDVDRQEAERLGRRTGRSVSFPATSGAPGADSAIERRLKTGAGSPAIARELRAIRLRHWALASGEWPEQEKAPHDWAESALEEGELLALRLPNEGKRLLGLAERLFEQAGDLPGVIIASIRS